jgi:hypothetical protein
MGFLAQTFYDPIRAAANEAPPDWTRRWNGVGDAVYFDLPTGGNNVGPNVLYTENGNDFGGYSSLLTWDRFDLPEHQSADTDILMLFQYLTGPIADDSFVVVCRASGPQGTEDSYVFRDTSVVGEMEVTEVSAGVESILATLTVPTIVSLTWYWLQFQCIGDQLKARIWEYGTQSPSNWMAEVTDGTHTAAGWVGFGSSHGDDTEIDFFHVATDGDSAQMPRTIIVQEAGISATPLRVEVGGTSLLVFTGEPNKTVDWSIISGDGSLNVIGEETDDQGQAIATYSPGTVDTLVTIQVEYGT